MKFAIPIVLGVSALLFAGLSCASEAAGDPESAVRTLRDGIEAHPDQALVLFRDALQTNPQARAELLEAALILFRSDPVLPIRLLHAARLEFPEDDARFAETALLAAPERASDIRAAFLATPQEMEAARAAGATAAGELPLREPPAESRELDAEIREAIARVAAKTEGKAWPEQALSGVPVRFKKPDEIRIPRLSRYVDESGLVNHLPVDREDEQAIADGAVKIDDAWRPSDALRLDESKFAGSEASVAPREATVRAMATAGSVGLPKRPRLPRSSVYHIPSAADSYESTIDLESGDSAPPALVIRPEPASPSSPR